MRRLKNLNRNNRNQELKQNKSAFTKHAEMFVLILNPEVIQFSTTAKPEEEKCEKIFVLKIPLKLNCTYDDACHICTLPNTLHLHES